MWPRSGADRSYWKDSEEHGVTMSDIQFMEKPDWVSWDDIRECLNKSHKTNKKRGFEMEVSNLTTDKLIDKIKGSRCVVALLDQKVIGVCCVRIEQKKKWWVRDKVAYYLCDAILPEFRGTDVYFGINNIRDRIVRESGVRVHQFNTADHNKTVIKINKRYGYKLVQFSPTGKGCNYYSVTMVKWDNGCPFPDWFLSLMFNLSKVVSKTLWKPGYIRRFWFN